MTATTPHGDRRAPSPTTPPHPTTSRPAIRVAAALLVAALGALTPPVPAAGQDVATSAFASMQYRHIGPLGNRITSVAGVPGDRFTYYAGAASGGLWKTEDGGVNWRPVFDDQPVHSVGEVEVSQSDPNIVWAGTGEPFIRSNVSIGNGVWKSTDAGETWTHMGLEGTGRISRIIVHPTNPDIVHVAAIGHGYAPQRERGIYRTLDGGESWEHVLFVDEETGASDLVMDPNNPRILFAGTWQIAIRTWTRTSGGPGKRHSRVARRGGDVDAAERQRAADARRGEDRAVHEPRRFPAHLRADRDGRRGAVGGRRHRRRRALALRRRGARVGRWSATTATWRDARPTTRAARSTRTTPTRRTSLRRPTAPPWTAASRRARRGSWRGPPGTATTCGSTRPTARGRSWAATAGWRSRATGARRGTGSSCRLRRCTT